MAVLPVQAAVVVVLWLKKQIQKIQPCVLIVDHHLKPAQNHTALLVFSRTAAGEAASKRYLGQRDRNKKIAQAFINHTLAVAAASDLPVYPVFEPEQEGVSFGERLANALETVYHKGHTRVIVLGTDCPTLDARHIATAAHALEHKAMVLGPATDGGLYLIGLTKDAYDRKRFLALPWLTAALTVCCRQSFAIAGNTVCMLPPLADVDNSTHLLQWLHLSPSQPLAQTVTDVVAATAVIQKSAASFLFVPSLSCKSTVQRGPPVQA